MVFQIVVIPGICLVYILCTFCYYLLGKLVIVVALLVIVRAELSTFYS